MEAVSVQEFLSVIFGHFEPLLLREIGEREQKHGRSGRGTSNMLSYLNPDHLQRGV